MEAVADGKVAERRDHWFEVGATYDGGELDRDPVQVRPGVGPTRVTLKGDGEVELVDLRRALKMAEDANR